MFTIRNFEARTVSWWFDQQENIDFAPTYQRKGRIWSKSDKAYLIDSILNGFDMPKIYVADFTFFNSELNENKKPYAVIDGKQRFEAIFDFYSDKLTLADDFVYNEDTTLKLGGLSLKDLKAKYPKIASKFENFNISVFSVITDSEGLINELFIRLNSSKPLTGAELRNAMQGAVPKYIKKLTFHDFFKDKVKFNIKRGQDSNVAGKLLLIEFRGKFVDTKRIHLDKLVEESVINAETTNIDSSYKSVVKILDYMNSSFIDKDPLLSASGIIPVYYWFFRQVGWRKTDIVRNFLVDFDKKRKATRTKKESELAQNEFSYVLFDRLSKSLNDRASLSGCFNILLEEWLQWSLENLSPFKITV